MKLSKEQFLAYKPLQNYVLTESVYRTDVIKFKTLELYLPKNEESDQPVVQRVIKVPRKLIYGTQKVYVKMNLGLGAKEWDGKQHERHETITRDKKKPGSMPWNVEMELHPDDIIWVSFMTILNCQRTDRVIDIEDKKYFLIPYEDVYFKKTDDNIQMLNGWILVEPVKIETETEKNLADAGVTIQKVTVEKDKIREYGINDKYGIVKYIAPPIEERLDGIPDADDISPGDTVVFLWNHNRRLEHNAHKFFSEGELIVTRRERIIAKITDELF